MNTKLHFAYMNAILVGVYSIVKLMIRFYVHWSGDELFEMDGADEIQKIGQDYDEVVTKTLEALAAGTEGDRPS